MAHGCAHKEPNICWANGADRQDAGKRHDPCAQAELYGSCRPYRSLIHSHGVLSDIGARWGSNIMRMVNGSFALGMVKKGLKALSKLP